MMTEDQEPAARLAEARTFLLKQDYKQVGDLTYVGKDFGATILTGSPTMGLGRPSYVVRFNALKAE